MHASDIFKSAILYLSIQWIYVYLSHVIVVSPVHATSTGVQEGGKELRPGGQLWHCGLHHTSEPLSLCKQTFVQCLSVNPLSHRHNLIPLNSFYAVRIKKNYFSLENKMLKIVLSI